MIVYFFRRLYLSLTDMLKAKDGDFFITDWLRNRNTLEYIGIWEQVYNPDFNYGEFAIIKSQSGLNSFKISVKEFVARTNAISIQAKAGRYGGTYAHKDITFEFAIWISPEFKIYIVKEFQRLKEDEQKLLGWTAKRELSKINYKIHTDAIKNNLPVVLGTTGHTEEELEEIKAASEKIPVFKSGNMSIAVNVLCRLAAGAASVLDGFDIEIIETHHRTKLDAPSGTALMIASSIEEIIGERTHTYDRTQRSEKRPEDEIGIHSVRGGTDIGEHEVIFFGNGERLSIKHVAEGRELFAHGALRACSYLIGKPAGYYDMRTLLMECGPESRKNG